MAVEEQTQYEDAGFIILSTTAYPRAGQRLTISGRTVTKLGFWLRKYGTPAGSFYFATRKVSDDSIIVRELVATADSLTTTISYVEHTFASPPAVDEEVRILVEYPFGDAANMITTYRKLSDVKADEYSSYDHPPYFDDAGADHAYKYTYEEPAAIVGGINPALLELITP